MFLVLDESIEHRIKVIGGLLVPIENLFDLEREFIKFRVQNNLFGEVKWSKVTTSYLGKYKGFVDLFFNETKATYHGIAFDADNQYRAAYSLIRNITLKLTKYGIRRPLKVLFDENGTIGEKGTKEIQRIASTIDRRFLSSLDFCGQGTSQVLNSMCIADIISGAIACKLNSAPHSQCAQDLTDHITSKNSGIPLDFVFANRPKLYSEKIHFLNPIAWANRP